MSSWSRRLRLGFVVLLAAASCGLPNDPEGTLERVTGGAMRVGITENPPWVVLGADGPSGVEVEIVELFAAELGAEVEWHEGSAEDLAAALAMRELDILAGGIVSTSGLAAHGGLTHPYLTTQVVVAVPPGTYDGDIAGLEVAVETATEEAGVLEKTDADPVRVEDVTTVDGPVAVDGYLVDDLGLDDTGVRLSEVDHVMAVPHGENAWLVRLERFLLDHEDDVHRILEEEGAP
ncbi:MAG TPA: transporter substrate-binding domain-containing protein [Actinomycetota bacterium]|nr:transporter substrate-binding domain-containing protein [Actinomycetota bacterium]